MTPSRRLFTPIARHANPVVVVALHEPRSGCGVDFGEIKRRRSRAIRRNPRRIPIDFAAPRYRNNLLSIASRAGLL
jgi:hypothetical protein